MKTKLFYSILAASAAMMFTSCSQDELGGTQSKGDEATIDFTIDVPTNIGTRAFGDGSQVQKLNYAVYYDGITLVPGISSTETTVPINEKKAEVKLRLLKGRNYKVVFWAATDACPYKPNWSTKDLTLDESALTANNEAYDAFYKCESITPQNDENRSITLTRPFAQLNIGTDDKADAVKAGLALTQTQVTLKQVPTVMRLTTGSTSTTKDITYTYSNIPEGETFPVSGYEYLAMNYVLTSDSKQTVDVEFNYDPNDETHHTATYANVPIQRNYRTNIYGSLLTNKVNYNVTINPAWEQPDYYQNIIEVNSQEQLQQAATTPKATIKLKENTTFELPRGNNSLADGVTIVGSEGSVLETYAYLHPDEVSSGSEGLSNASYLTNVTFKNLTIKECNKNYTGLHHSDYITYENCVIEGCPFSYATHAVFNNCTFKQTDPNIYNIWSYGSKDLTFNNCTFNCAGRAVNVFKENGTEWYKVTFNKCHFNASANTTGKAAIEIDSSLNPFEVYINNCTSTGFNNGSHSGNSLWNNKKGSDANVKVYVDGVQQTLNW